MGMGMEMGMGLGMGMGMGMEMGMGMGMGPWCRSLGEGPWCHSLRIGTCCHSLGVGPCCHSLRIGTCCHSLKMGPCCQSLWMCPCCHGRVPPPPSPVPAGQELSGAGPAGLALLTWGTQRVARGVQIPGKILPGPEVSLGCATGGGRCGTEPVHGSTEPGGGQGSLWFLSRVQCLF